MLVFVESSDVVLHDVALHDVALVALHGGHEYTTFSELVRRRNARPGDCHFEGGEEMKLNVRGERSK